MEFKFSTAVRDSDILRESFNNLTRRTFGFDFNNWYEAGHWGEWYIPHVLLDGERVVSNVSVNLMQFDVEGVKKNYIQLGTVMTDKEYRGQGLNRKIMEHILDEYSGKVDGIYLFGNDSVLEYYPKFGFKQAREYEYYMQFESNGNNTEKAEGDKTVKNKYIVEKVDMTEEKQCEKLYDMIRNYKVDSDNLNQNDAMFMNQNLGLFQFWLDNEYGNQVYYLPEKDAYVVAEAEGEVLHVLQIFGKEYVDISCFAKSFADNVKEVVLGYTPVNKEQFCVREYMEEDCTLFILGDDLLCIGKERMRFPVLSHA